MDPRAKRGRAAAGRSTVLVVLASSAVVHAALVATIDVSSPAALAAARRREAPILAEAADWAFTCDADAMLASSIRLGACASPFGGALERCVAAALERLEADRRRCASPEDVEVAFVDPDDLDLMPVPLLDDVAPVEDVVAAQLIEEEVAKKLEEAQRPIEAARPRGQVVEITPPEVEVAPDSARYLSEHDSKVDRQTVARGSTEEMVARPRPRELPPVAAERPPEATPAPRDGRAGAPGEPASPPPPDRPMLAMRDPTRTPEAPAPKGGAPGERGPTEVASIDGLEPRRGDRGMLGGPTTAEGTEPASSVGGEGGEGGVAPPLELRPTEELLERTVGGGSVDHLEDAESGDFTALNSRKWKFGGFFNRIKRQVAQNWHPDDVYVRRDPSGKVYGAKDRVTVLQVSLTPTGSIAKVYVAQPSGVDFLDDEAVRAFREAQPFPNPPTGLVDARSNLITFSFGFHFQIGGDRTRWRVFRPN